MATTPMSFEESRSRRRLTAIVWTVGLVLTGIGAYLLATDGPLPGAAMLACGVGDLWLATFWSRSRVRSVTVGPDGVRVRLASRREALLPWRDIGAWEFGQPLPSTGGPTVKPAGLVLWPADHVAEPPPESRPFWQSGSRCWSVCKLSEIQATEDELLAAMRTHAPKLERTLGDQAPQPPRDLT